MFKKLKEKRSAELGKFFENADKTVKANSGAAVIKKSAKTLKTASLQTKIMAFVLSLTVLSTGLVAIIVPHINTADAAGETPGTAAYYEARWEDAKVKAGNLAVGTAYTTNTGASATTTAEGPWKLDIDYSTCSAPWNGNLNGTVPTVGAGTIASPYEVTTAEQFRYCLVNHTSFKLMKDIDLAGYTGRQWETPVGGNDAWTADGNGCTVYNFYVYSTNKYTSLFGIANKITIQNLRVSNSYEITTAGRSAIMISFAEGITIDNCAVENTMLYGEGRTAILCDADVQLDVKINKSYTKNCHLAAFDADISTIGEHQSCSAQIIRGAWGCVVKDSFSIDGTVIGDKGHNGGFASCVGAFNCAYFDRCFSNIDIYGNSDAAVFLGVVHGDAVVTNCYASGKIEGTKAIGGFYGAVGDRVGTISIKQCYSTSVVGMTSKAAQAGSFFGSVQGAIDTTSAILAKDSKIEDCYGAGETGVIGTNVQSDRNSDFDVAGFTGLTNNYLKYSHCYYDKQTTAMKEWAIGGKTADTQCTSDQCQAKGANWDIKGVLTTDTDKSKTGLSSTPSSNGTGTSSFTGFSDNSQWTFVQNYYPQLSVFSNPTSFTGYKGWITDSMAQDLVKAYSQASVSTVMLDTYDTDYNDTVLPKETYDTVRDVTGKFPLTSDSNLSWARVGVTGQGTLANGTGAKTTALQLSASATPQDVIDLYKQGSTWYGDHPMPGIDWVKSTATVGNQVGTRALRICPTVGIDAGLSQYIGKGEIYDHANDVSFVYSTGSRMAKNVNDFTYGVYPDNPLESRQQQLLEASAFHNLTALTAKYSEAGQDNAYSNIDALYMQRTGTGLTTGVPSATTASGGKLNEVVIRKILSESADGTVLYGNKIDLSDSNSAESMRWNGLTAFSSDSVHQVYSVEYVWSLADGRYVKDSKRIEYPALSHNVTINIENENGIRLINKAYLDAYSIANSDGSLNNTIEPVFSDSLKSEDWLLGQSHAYPAATSWKMETSAEPIKEVQVTIMSIDGTLTKTVTIPASGLPGTAGTSTTFKAIAPYRTYSYDASGTIVWTTHEIEKTYTITLNGDGVYTIKFDKEYADWGNGVYIDDVDMDIEVTVVIKAPDPQETNAVYDFHNKREDVPWAGGDTDVINDMPNIG